jgi:UDP-N-acetylmuramoyl-tripeptide--D-alanyl-D-alanine ligase
VASLFLIDNKDIHTVITITELYTLFQQYPNVQTDTRKLQPGDMFFALKGPSFNGNLFALQALQQGASYAVVDEDVAPGNEKVLLVEDVLTTLQQLAKYHRQQFDIPFIAITGSNGKTTTKELVSTVLASHYTTYTTQGNLNNHIGVPLTLLSIKPDAEMAVIEMGANHQKEIAGYCEYTLPTHGIITNCGKAHLEGFGGEEGVRKGKGELYDFLRLHDGAIFLFDDYEYLHSMSRGIQKQFIYGTHQGDVIGQVTSSNPFIHVHVKDIDTEIKTHLVGSYNLPNVLCAVAVGTYFNVPVEKIVHAIEKYQPSNSRSQMIEQGSNKIILDAYNANPSSMKVAIENFAKLQADHKVLMLGGMMELGNDSVAEHQQVVELIHQYPWKYVVLVGGDFASTHNGTALFLPDAAAAKDWFKQKGFEQTHFLIKGSRSMQMEKIIQP